MPNWTILRNQLYARCRGHCEVSGKPILWNTFDAHHRRNKGMGGTARPDRDSLHNLLALDPDVHNGGPESVHGRRAWSQARGYLIPKQVDDVTLWPVWLHGQQWVLIRPDGKGYLHVAAPPPDGGI